MAVLVREYELTKPGEHKFNDTKLELASGHQPVSVAVVGERIIMSVLVKTDEPAHEETFRVTESELDLKPIFGADEWAYRGSVVDQTNSKILHVWALPSFIEREAQMRQKVGAPQNLIQTSRI